MCEEQIDRGDLVKEVFWYDHGSEMKEKQCVQGGRYPSNFQPPTTWALPDRPRTYADIQRAMKKPEGSVRFEYVHDGHLVLRFDDYNQLDAYLVIRVQIDELLAFLREAQAAESDDEMTVPETQGLDAALRAAREACMTLVQTIDPAVSDESLVLARDQARELAETLLQAGHDRPASPPLVGSPCSPCPSGCSRAPCTVCHDVLCFDGPCNAGVARECDDCCLPLCAGSECSSLCDDCHNPVCASCQEGHYCFEKHENRPYDSSLENIVASRTDC